MGQRGKAGIDDDDDDEARVREREKKDRDLRRKSEERWREERKKGFAMLTGQTTATAKSKTVVHRDDDDRAAIYFCRPRRNRFATNCRFINLLISVKCLSMALYRSFIL